MKKERLKKEIDLSYITTNEPEGFDFYRKKGLVFCGQEGGVFEIKTR